MGKYDDLIPFIFDNIGGEKNIISSNHCATRLRLKLGDASKFNEDKLKNNSLIMGTVKRDNEVQLIIGPDVDKVYSLFNKEWNKSEFDNQVRQQKRPKKNLKSYGTLIVDFISGTFVPVLPILVAAGLVSAVLNILVTFFGVSTTSGTYTILNTVNNAGFYFLPIYIGYSAAKKIGINGMMGMFLGAILVHSAIDGAKGLSFFDLSIPITTYNTTTIPVIFGVLFMALVDKGADKVIPDAIKFFLKPLIVILITVPITLILLGPLGNIVGGYIVSLLGFMFDKMGWLSVGILGGLTPLLVMTGTNQALFPLVFAMMAESNYDPFVLPAMLAANVAVGAAALAISLQEKNVEKRSLALSAGITGVMGITEPAVFGVMINYSSAFIGAITGGVVGGIFAGLVSLKQYAVVSPGIAAIPTYIPTNGSGLNSNFWFFIAILVVSVCVSFTVTIVLEKRKRNKLKIQKADSSFKILSPVQGTVLPIEQVNDPLFSEKMMGDGLAIMPSEGVIVAPFDGYVIMTTPTKHAIGLRGDNDVEILIHIGMDTVNLNGEFYNLLVEEEQYVYAGDVLIEFDMQAIAEKGFDLITPVIVTNSAEHDCFAKTIQKEVKKNDYLFSVS